ncbi:MAG: hypothetical protein IH605_14630 [Burkholderiales bacterium]|nr:hypothetical protein [Burkholderiales bacterium]
MFNNASYGDVLRDRRNVYREREIGSALIEVPTERDSEVSPCPHLHPNF